MADRRAGDDGVATPFVTTRDASAVAPTQTITGTITGPLAVGYGYVTVTSGGGVTAAGYAITSAGTLVSDGLVSGGALGVVASAGYVGNQSGGRIVGGTSAGVSLSGSASLANSGTITGGDIGVAGYGTVTNAGTIAGGGAAPYAVSFKAGMTSLLVADPGAVFVGTVDGGNRVGATAASTLEFAGTGAGTFAGLGSRYLDFARISVASGAVWTAAGGNSLAAGETLVSDGTLASSGSLANAGLIAASSTGPGVGIYFDTGMFNNTGTVSGASHAIIARYVGSGTVANGGLLSASPGAGTAVYLYGATLLNQSAGTVAGWEGVDLGRAARMVNDGFVTGAAFGLYAAGGVATNDAGGTIAGGAAGISGYGTFIDAGTIAATGTARDAVSLAVSAASLLVVDPGAVFAGAVDGGSTAGSAFVSTLEFAAGTGTMEGFGSTVSGFGRIRLDAGADWLLAGSASGLGGGETISGFAPGSTIELAGTSETYAAFSGGYLTLSGGTTLDLTGAAHVNVATLAGSTFITACFAGGTEIATERGRVRVEALGTGDRVLTASGRLAAVRWIGHRRTSLARYPRPLDVMPVRVRAGAFGDGLPVRDPVLSPDHAVFAEGRLIPIRHLVNNVSIVQETREAVTYWHVELDRHDVILAEGLACESYLDTGNRPAFENAQGAVAMTPDFARGVWAAEGCAPIVTDTADAALRALHTRLLARGRRLAAGAPALRSA